MLAEYRRFVPGGVELLAAFLTGEDWSYFASGRAAADRIREQRR